MGRRVGSGIPQQSLPTSSQRYAQSGFDIPQSVSAFAMWSSNVAGREGLDIFTESKF
jgi:hypothetical protein